VASSRSDCAGCLAAPSPALAGPEGWRMAQRCSCHSGGDPRGGSFGGAEAKRRDDPVACSARVTHAPGVCRLRDIGATQHLEKYREFPLDRWAFGLIFARHGMCCRCCVTREGFLNPASGVPANRKFEERI
jgi:hypothetical protein